MSIIFYENQDLQNFEDFERFIRKTYKKAGQEIVDEEPEEEDEEEEVAPSVLEMFNSEASELLENEDFLGVIEKVFELQKTYNLEQVTSALLGANTFFVQKIEDQKKRQQAIQLFIKGVHELENQTFQTKQQFISTLFNSLTQYPQDQQKVFNELLNMSAKEGKLQTLQKTFLNIDTVTTSWQLSSVNQRALYKQIIESLEKITQMQELKFGLMVKYISNFELKELNEKEIPTIQSYIIALLSQENITFIQSSILDTEVFKFLQSKNFDVSKALQFYVTGNLAGFLEFQKKNSGAVSKLGLNEDQFSRFIRIKAIPQFCESGENIQFKDFASQLQVGIDDVEEWIVMAIQYNLIEAQIDQYNETINIVSNKNKFFQEQDWKDLDKQIQATIDKLNQSLKFFEEQQ